MNKRIDIGILFSIDCKETIINLNVQNWDELFDKIISEIEKKSGHKLDSNMTISLFEETEAKDIHMLKKVFNNKVPIEEIMDINSLVRNICLDENREDIFMCPVITKDKNGNVTSAMTAMLNNEVEKVNQIKKRYFTDWG